MNFPKNMLEPLVFNLECQLTFDFCDPFFEINRLINEHIKNQTLYGTYTINLMYDGEIYEFQTPQ